MNKRSEIGAKLLLYSKCKDTEQTIATFIITFPKFIQAHINSHRALSRNANSSRATPAKVLRRRIIKDPYLPIEFGKERSGMRGGEEIQGVKLFISKKVWLWSRYIPCVFHFIGEKMGIHKEIINRIIEPWTWTQVILTSTEFSNFIKLRADNAAQPEIQKIAKDIKYLLDNNIPTEINSGDWHIPFIKLEEIAKYDIETLKKIATARCARISYKLYNGTLSNPEKDIELCNKLIKEGHWSPFEHVAQALSKKERIGNFVGFKQYRKFFENENGGDYYM